MHQMLLKGQGTCLLVCVLYEVIVVFCRLVREQLNQLNVFFLNRTDLKGR